jgi:hypothetical protein
MSRLLLFTSAARLVTTTFSGKPRIIRTATRLAAKQRRIAPLK